MDEKDRILLKNWSLWITRHGYIACDKRTKESRTRIFLHHLIIGKPSKGFVVDHKNGNPLDNRRENLHFVTQSYNMTNTLKRKDSRQPLKGIQILPSGSFSVKITGGKRIGTFKTLDEAANHYKNYIFTKFNMPTYVTTR